MPVQSRFIAAAMLSLSLVGAAAAAPSARTAAIARAALLETPLYAVIDRLYPATFKRMVDLLSEGLDAGKSMSDIILSVRPIYLALVADASQKADATSTLGLMDLTRGQAREALAKGPDYCLDLLGIVDSPALPYEYLSRASLAREGAWTASLLEQVAAHPAGPPAALAPGALKRVSVAAYDSLPDDGARAALSGLEGELGAAKTPAEQRAACLFTVGMLDALIAEGDAGAEIYRSIQRSE